MIIIIIPGYLSQHNDWVGGLTAEESQFDSQQEKEIFLFSVASAPVLLPTQPPIELDPVAVSRGCNKRCLINYAQENLQPFVGPWPLSSFLILYTFGRTPWTGHPPVTRPLLTHRAAHTRNKRTQTSMHCVRFEPTIPVFERTKTVLALDCTITVIGNLPSIIIIIIIIMRAECCAAYTFAKQ
jgi:hypothetical protein